jgi:hypothetical protein
VLEREQLLAELDAVRVAYRRALDLHLKRASETTTSAGRGEQALPDEALGDMHAPVK